MDTPADGEKWYLAILVIASRVDGASDDAPSIDLQYKLVRAVDAESAYRRALELGAGEAHDYLNDAGARVHWEFAGLHDLHEIEAEDLRHGVEVYSRTERVHPGERVITKEQLEVFWWEANKHRTAADILGEDTA